MSAQNSGGIFTCLIVHDKFCSYAATTAARLTSDFFIPLDASPSTTVQDYLEPGIVEGALGYVTGGIGRMLASMVPLPTEMRHETAIAVGQRVAGYLIERRIREQRHRDEAAGGKRPRRRNQ